MNALRQYPEGPTVWLTPYAHWRLQWLCHASDNEVSAMGVLGAEGPGMVINDFILVRQQVSPVTVNLDMKWWGDRQVELFERDGIEPWQLSCWTHTHPAGVNRPSQLDERTMRESFGAWDLALMLILTRSGDFYCRLEFNHEYAPQLSQRFSLECPVRTTWQGPLWQSVSEDTLSQWQDEFSRLVSVEPVRRRSRRRKKDEQDWLVDMSATIETQSEEEREYEEYCAFCDEQGMETEDPDAYGFWTQSASPAPVRSD